MLFFTFITKTPLFKYTENFANFLTNILTFHLSALNKDYFVHVRTPDAIHNCV